MATATTVTMPTIRGTRVKATRGTTTTGATRATTTMGTATTAATRAITATGTIRVTTVTTTGSANLLPWQASALFVARAPSAWH
jgi:hypothetical protein